MRKNSMTLAVLFFCALLLLAGCSDPTDPSSSGNASGAAVTGQSGTQTAAENAAVEKTVSFGLDETVVHEGLCEMDDLYSEVLDDAAMAEGWYYYYTDSDVSPAPIISWKPSGENYTTVEVLFTVKNISDKPQTFGDKITARMLYRENEEAQTEYYSGTVFQQNPGQVNGSGEIVMWSTKPVEIAVGGSANVSFRFDIPKAVYDKIYETATGADTQITEICEFGFGDGTTYEVDLEKALILASQYDFSA